MRDMAYTPGTAVGRMSARHAIEIDAGGEGPRQAAGRPHRASEKKDL
jgi:hypothetical protein